jgi:hypothetical protein
MGPRDGLDIVKYRKISCPCPESNAGRPARSPLLYQLNYLEEPPVPTGKEAHRPGVGLDTATKRKISACAGNQTLRHPTRSQVTTRQPRSYEQLRS